MRVVDELMNGYQLDGRDSECGQIFDGGRMSQAGVGSSLSGWDRGMAGGESFDVNLVDDRFVERHVRGTIVAPVEVRIVNDGFRNVRGVVLVVAGALVAEVV